VGPGELKDAYRRDRRRMVEELRSRGIEDLAVLHAFDAVPRHLFVPEEVRHRAYEDTALPIGHGQTISRPAAHALHLSLAGLEGDERVLEVGTGSGFQTALLARLAGEVRSVERVRALAERARERLAGLGADNVVLRVGDGSRGWPEEAPFDVILVGAAAPDVPGALKRQLAPDGLLLIPVGDDDHQELVRVDRSGDRWATEVVDAARFVPLVGDEGW
jgi:protein-L-isoaspartate(D-aspartate) O-methyltransferase